MKLQVKLALYNAISKAIIVFAIGAIIPSVLRGIVYDHIDKRLNARMEKMLRMVQLGGLKEITLDQDCTFDSYNVFKEEYVSISPLPKLPLDFGSRHTENTVRVIEEDVVRHRVLSQSFLYDNQLYEIEVGEGLSTIDQLNITIRVFTFRIMFAVILLSIFFDLAFSRILLRPFNKIVNEKLKDIRHPASFVFTPIKTNTYEFSHLDTSINEMMQKINETFQLEREFITNVSHELLTPISILQNRLENIINEPGLSTEVAARLVDTQKTLSRLTRIVKALLYISRIENEQFLKNDSVHIRQLVEEAIDEIEDRIIEHNIQVHQEWTDDYELTNCNRSLLHTMIFNLLSNAIKYNVEGGEIYISGVRKNQGFELIVRDTGQGISDEHLQFIFDRFKRFHPEDNVSFGLGLPIVRTIANFHKIGIRVESQLKKGTSFILSFNTHLVT